MECRLFARSISSPELPSRQSPGANSQKSPVAPANIPVSQRLSAETGFDQDCRPREVVELLHVSVPARPKRERRSLTAAWVSQGKYDVNTSHVELVKTAGKLIPPT